MCAPMHVAKRGSERLSVICRLGGGVVRGMGAPVPQSLA